MAVASVGVLAVIGAGVSVAAPAANAAKKNAHAVERYSKAIFVHKAKRSTFGKTSRSLSLDAGATVIAAPSANFGMVLENAEGFVLYTNPSDRNGISNCSGSCQATWPALTVAAGATPTAGSGVDGTIAAVLQPNGTYQVTYNGAPLYTYLGDNARGEVTGNNVQGFIVAQALAPSPSSPAPAGSPTPAASPAPSLSPTPATGTPNAGATSPGGSSSGTPAASPSTVSPGATPRPVAPAAFTSPQPAAGSPSLPTTGPSAALMWMMIVGLGLLIAGAWMFAVGDDRRPGTRSARQAVRASTWLLGR